MPEILYYGVNGDGRGLVDAMSGFCVKSPLWRKIVVDDFFFESANELSILLQCTFEDDPMKVYTTISSDELRNNRRKKGGVPISGCQKARMIALFPDGTYQLSQRLCNCKSCLLGIFDKCSLSTTQNELQGGVYYSELEEELISLDETDDLIEGDSFVYAEPGKYMLCTVLQILSYFICTLLKRKLKEMIHWNQKLMSMDTLLMLEITILKVFTLRKTVKTKIVFSIRNLRNVLMFIRAQCFVLMYHLIRKACLNKIDYVQLCQQLW